MNSVVLVLAGIVLLFGFVVLYGAPYLPTRKKQTNAALDLLDLKPGQTLLELGCGDGRVLRYAAARGIRGVGYELNPILVAVAWLMTLRYRKLVTIKWANFWSVEWSEADGIFVFLLDKYMSRLDKKIDQQARPVKLATFAFKVPGRQVVKQKAGVFLYQYK